MALRSFSFAVAIAGLASPVFAQTSIPAIIDCTDPANAENAVCLPEQGVTDFVPLVAPVLGVLGIGLLAGGGGGGGSTTSTTSTN